MERSYVKEGYPLSEVTGRIIVAAIEVHRHRGPGFEEVKLLALIAQIRQVWYNGGAEKADCRHGLCRCGAPQ